MNNNNPNKLLSQFVRYQQSKIPFQQNSLLSNNPMISSNMQYAQSKQQQQMRLMQLAQHMHKLKTLQHMKTIEKLNELEKMDPEKLRDCVIRPQKIDNNSNTKEKLDINYNIYI